MAALLLAVGVAIAGYSVALSLGRGPIGTTDKPELQLTIERPQPPTRLAPHRDNRAFAVPASASRPSAAHEYGIALQGFEPDLFGAGAGLAAFAPRTGIMFAWAPISESTRGPDGIAVLTIRAPAREVVLTLSGERRFARRGYLARKRVRLDPNTRSIEFDVTAAATQFVLVEGAERSDPLQLSRIDDPEWLPIAVAPGGLLFESNSATILLGAGEYELVDPVDPTVRQRFRVPAADAIRIESRLARPPGRLP